MLIVEIGNYSAWKGI